MAIQKVVVVDGNNLIVRIDRGVAGRSVTDVDIVESSGSIYLVFTFSDGTTETVGPVGTIAYVGQSPIVVNASTISLTTVPVNLGGTGQITANAGFNALAPTQTGNTGKYLKTDGTNSAWDLLDISTADITGTLPILNGGTGQTTANASFNALAPNQATNTGKYLKTDGTNTSWDLLDISTADITGVLPIANGGTNASTISAARTNLGLGTIATQDASAIAITGGTITGITDLAVADGGTGSSTAAGAMVNLLPSYTGNANKRLGLDGTATGLEWVTDGGGTVTSVDVSGGTTGLSFTGGPVTTSGTITLSGTLDLDNGGTGATTASGARTNLNAADQATTISAGTGLSGGGDLSANRTLSIANTTVTAAAYGSASNTLTATVNAQGQLTALAATPIAIANTQISGLGTMSTQNANAVAITGGSITGITDLAVADGGTGASDAAGARTNLNAADQAITITAGTGLSGGGNLSANRTIDIANTTVTAGAFGSASNTLTATVNAQGQLTALAATPIAIANTQVSGLGTMSTQNSNAVTITGGSITGITDLAIADGGTGASNAPDARSNLGLGSAAVLNAGVALGVATLDAGGTVPLSQIPASIQGGVSYQGAWNASTNTPTLVSSVGSKGYYYVVSVAGNTNLNGVTDWLVGDWAIYNGTAWEKIDNTDQVASVNGYTGVVVLSNTDVGAPPTSLTISAGTGLSGGGSLAANRTLSIANTTVTAAPYGTASAVPTFTVNGQGQLTTASDVTIAIANTQVSGLGTMSTQNANSVAITGGSITGITDLAVADGGTGASTAADARTNLNAAYNAITISAGTGLTGGGDLTANRTLAIDSSVVTLTGTQTLTNKTITSPLVNEILDTNGNEILGLSPTASATDFVTVKNGIGTGVPLHIYADGPSANIGLHLQPKGTGLITISDGTDFNKGIRFRSSGSAASAVTLLDAVSTAGRVVTLPDATTTLVGRDTTDTLTNKTIAFGSNTFSGSLAIANGGTGQATANAAFNALAPSQTGNSGKYLTTDGTDTSWASNPLGTVTSVAASVPSFLSIAGSPITTSGTLAISLSGTALPTTSGGTGLTSFTSGGVVYASSTSALATGSALTFDGTNLGVNNAGIDFKYNGTVYANATIAGLDYVFTTSNGAVPIINSGASTHIWRNAGVEALRLTSTSLYTASGINVGVGTNDPQRRIDAQSTTADYQLRLGYNSSFYYDIGRVNSNGYLGFYGSQTNATGFIFGGVDGTWATINSTGNMGLGVTPVNAYTGLAYKNFELPKAAFFSFDVTGSRPIMGLKSNIYYDSGGNVLFNGNGYGVQYLTDSGNHQWYTSTISNSSGAGASATMTQAMTLTAAGLLSVGTTNASGAIIRGQGALNSNAYYYLDANVPFGGGTSGQYSSVLGFALYTDSGVRSNSQAEIRCISDGSYSGSLAFLTQNPGTYPNTVTERMRIGSGGRVGIGTTDPYGNLSVFMGTTAPQDSFYYDNVNMLQIGETSARGLAGLFAKRSTYAGASGYDGDLAFYNLFYAGAADYQWKERMRIQANGDVGVGENTPSYRLDVKSGAGDGSGAVTTLRLKNAGTTVGDGARLLFTSGTSTTGGCAIAGYGTSLNAASMLFYASGTDEKMRLDGTNGLQIGTNAGNCGANGLHVTGTILQGASGLYQAQIAISGGNTIQASTLGVGYENLILNPLGGNLLVGTATGSTDKVRIIQSASNNVTFFRNSNATTVYGIQIEYNNRVANSTGEEFIYCGDTSPRFTARSNGGLANYSANNVNLSDRREKTNFAPAKSYLDVICAIPVQTFNYIDQNLEEDGGLTLGVVAQDVQAVAPELVMESNWANREDEPKMRLSIYQTDLQYALMKALQELKAEFDAYKASHP